MKIKCNAEQEGQ